MHCFDAMVKRLEALPALVVMVAAAVSLMGCSVGRLTPTDAVNARSVELEYAPAPFSDGSFGKVVGPDRFVTMAQTKDDLLRLTMWNGRLDSLWTTDIAIPGRASKSARKDRPRSPMGEKPTAMYSDGKHLVMFGTRYPGESDSMIAIARLIDPATGQITATRTLTATKVSWLVEEPERQYSFRFSADSTTILCANLDYRGDNRDSAVLCLATFNGDLTPSRTRTVALEEATRMQTMRVDNLGDVILAARYGFDTCEVRRITMGGGRSDTTVALPLQHPDGDAPYITSYLADFTGSNDLALFAMYHNDQQFAGLQLAKVRTSTMERTLTTMLTLNQSDFRRALDTTFTSAEFHAIYFGPTADTRYLVTAYGSIGRTLSTMGSTFLMSSLTRDGKENWHAIHRLGGYPPLTSTISSEWTMRMICRERDGLMYDEFSLKDGARVPGSRRLIADADMYRVSSPSAFDFWPDDRTVIFFTSESYNDESVWYLNRFEIK